MQRFRDARDVFFNRRFGLFIHWGLYSIPAWHEQILWRGDMKRKNYEQLIHEFNPVQFDPDAWIDIALEAGMQYICFTTKHHDGFCMWNTAHTEYNVMNTPYGKDILKELSEACARRNVPLSLYYSCPDWHHPSYPNQGRHHEMFGPRTGDVPDLELYYEYVRKQLVELCTNYGPIYQFFWDVNVAGHEDPSLNELIRSLQPGILINNRGPGQGDYRTPERHVPKGGAFVTPTEACQSLGRESWGYKEDEDYYSYKFIMQSMDKILAMGGNYLLNVGPKPDGTICEENIAALKQIGNWYHRVKEAFDQTVPASDMIHPETTQVSEQGDMLDRDQVLITRNGNTLYIHLYQDPQTDSIILKPLDIQPRRATLLNDGTELEARVDLVPWYWKEKAYLRIRKLPVHRYTDTVMVLKLEFDESVCE
jgi:alpha-L-fucosidase